MFRINKRLALVFAITLLSLPLASTYPLKNYFRQEEKERINLNENDHIPSYIDIVATPKIRGITADGKIISNVTVVQTPEFELVSISDMVMKLPKSRRLREIEDQMVSPDFHSENRMEVIDKSAAALFGKRQSVAQTPPIINPTSNRDKFWELLKGLDDGKNDPIYSQTGTRPVLSTFRYIVLPIWWSDENPSDMRTRINKADIISVMDYTKKYYSKMSWGKLTLSTIVLDQVQIPVSSVSPGFGESEDAARAKVTELGYFEGENYDGVVLVYNNAQNGPFEGSGGWGNVNSENPFMWMSYPHGVGNSVARHEVGHNFGHPHHHSNKYYWRFERKTDEGSYDGYDMMSGGNGFAISDFALASKWFFGWIPDSAIVTMQPEGSKPNCWKCRKKGQFKIYAFDNHDEPPSSSKLMGIHIPISADDTTLYSYWLSYRVGNPAKRGLSVHLSWFSIPNGKFGGSYDSLNYDANGNTDTTYDSFVMPGTCYIIAPSSKMIDIDPVSSPAVQPVVCVDDIEEGKHITVSVSFLDPESPPVPKVEISNEVNAKCGEMTIDKSLDATKYSLIHFDGTGKNGEIGFSICPNSGSVSAFFFDSYPYSAVMYDAPGGYGSYKSIDASALQCCSLGSNISVDGGKVVKITNNNSDFLHLNEIEIYDKNGVNVALKGECFSKNIGYGGNPKCLNDGITGIYPETCNSHSSWLDPGNYDYCVLKEPVDIASINIYPWHDPTRTWMTDRIRSLKVEVFAEYGDTTDPGIGLLAFYDETRFSRSATGPQQTSVSLKSWIECPTDNGSSPSVQYTSEFDESWVLVVPNKTGKGMASIQSTCSVNSCYPGYKKKGNSCVECTSSDSDCIACPDGTSFFKTGCKVSETYQETFASLGWRIWVPEFYTIRGWVYDVHELQFYSTSDCTGQMITGGSPIDSGNAGNGWGPQNAFLPFATWGGRSDLNGIFWLGKTLDSPRIIRCIKLNQAIGGGATEIRVQALKGENWVNVMIKKDLQDGWQTIPFSSPETIIPTASPTIAPIASPTIAPTVAPTVVPMETFKIVSTFSTNKKVWCLQPKGLFSGALAIIVSCNDKNPNQKWLIDSYGKFRPAMNDKICLKVAGTNARLTVCSGGNVHRWEHSDISNRMFPITNAFKVMTIVNAWNRAPVKMLSRNMNSNKQSWEIQATT